MDYLGGPSGIAQALNRRGRREDKKMAEEGSRREVGQKEKSERFNSEA